MVRNFYQSDCPNCGLRRNGPHRSQGCQVTNDMLLAIATFAQRHGRQWKQKLRDCWTRGEDVGSELQRVRNIVGPTRLEKVKLPSISKGKPAPAVDVGSDGGK